MDFDSSDTKTQLFLAGVREFAARGYKGATVRAICSGAGAANVNALNYYFGGKENLYRAILDAMFAALGNRWETIDETTTPTLPPEEKLRFYIREYCTLLYAGAPLSREFTVIFLSEMIRPSAFLESTMESRVAPQTRKFLSLLRSLIGPEASEAQLRLCLVSVLGQLLYPAVVHPAIQSFFQGTITEDLEAFVEHAHRFALAGLQPYRDNAVRRGE